MSEHDQITDAQHDAADNAIVDNMTRRILTTEWGRQIIDGTIDECYASWVLKVSTSRDANGHVEHCNIIGIDPDTGAPSANYVLRHDYIARIIALIWNGRFDIGYPRDYIIDAITEHDAGCIDADAADVILQCAAFGEVIYG